MQPNSKPAWIWPLSKSSGLTLSRQCCCPGSKCNTMAFSITCGTAFGMGWQKEGLLLTYVTSAWQAPDFIIKPPHKYMYADNESSKFYGFYLKNNPTV